ncbi:MAG: hypothetical protein HW383_109 [Candidatus Magasanikbacteria bacterium]|nr:hypothetical protein [Candidatus Magasanikbacteria bacterium]
MRTPSHVGRLLGEREKDILDILWSRPEGGSVRDVVDHLHKKIDVAYTTIMTIMNRLVKKGVLKKNIRAGQHVFCPRLTRQEFYRTLAGETLGRIRKEFGEVAIACFLEETDKVDRKKLKKLLADLKRGRS